MIALRGRSMTLRRLVAAPDTWLDVPLLAFTAAYEPDELVAPLVQGDRRVEILHDEIAAAGWPWPPREPDVLQDGSESFTVLFAAPVWEAGSRIGWTLSVRGG